MSDNQTQITISADSVQAIVTKALFEEIGAEGRDTLIRQALSYLLTTPKNTGYGRTEESPLQYALNRAVEASANIVAREVVEAHPEVREHLRKMLGDVIVAMLEDTSYSAANEGLAKAIVDAVRTWLQDQARERD